MSKITQENIDLVALFKLCINYKKSIFVITFIFFSASLLVSLSIKNTYTSSAILAPTNQSANNLSQLSQYSRVASLTGFSIGTSPENTRVEMIIEEVRSLNFFEDLIEEENLFFELVATNGWDETENKLLIDSKIFDQASSKWVSKSKFSTNGKPSLQTAFRKYLSILTIVVNDSNGFVTISIEHYSPYFAKKFLDHLIEEINEKSKMRDIESSKNTIIFLENEAKATQLNEVRAGISNLIEKNIEVIAIANSSPEYLLTKLSEPYVSEIKSKPRRKLIVLLSTFFGLIFSLFFISFRFYTENLNRVS